MLPTALIVLAALMTLELLVLLYMCCRSLLEEDPDQQNAEQRVARAWAQWEALAARAQATLASVRQAPPPVPQPLPLPYFPYAAQGDKPSSETPECVICLEPLQPGQLCSEVPPCRHVFHRDCLGQWARSNGSCPLCRANIVPGSDEVAIADDMV